MNIVAMGVKAHDTCRHFLRKFYKIQIWGSLDIAQLT